MSRLWPLLARFLVNHPRLVDRLKARAARTPYTTLRGADGSLYMERYWLVGPTSLLRFVLPLMRFHVIHREDMDRDPHDHPWAFRSIILRGSYGEERFEVKDSDSIHGDPYRARTAIWRRMPGCAYRMDLGDFHKITRVYEGPVLTLCILGRRQETWGFLTDTGEKVPWRRYLGLPEDAAEGTQP